jgi:hypothetical protein
MKKNLGMTFGLSRWGVGAVLLALCAFTSASRADVIVDNTGNAHNPGDFVVGQPFGEVFTMSGTSGNLSSLTLVFDSSSTGSADVQVYNTSGGAPSTSLYDLGNITLSGNTLTTANFGSSDLLTAGVEYAIVLQSSSMAWDYTLDSTGSTGPGGAGSGLAYNFYASEWNQLTPGNNYFQMNLLTTPVPEIPITGTLMGFGALAIAFGCTLRRKLHSAVSSIA